MGRHSAPADEDVDEPAVEGTSLDLSPRVAGRHSMGDIGAPDEQPTQVIAVVDADLALGHSQDTAVTDELPVLGSSNTKVAAPEVAAPEVAARAAAEKKAADKAAADERKAAAKAAKQSAKAAQKAARGETNTQADLRLLRTNSAVRAQCIGAVVAAFALYTLVMAIIGQLGDYAVFVFIPIVVSGVLVGVVLDLAHRRASRTPPADTRPLK